MQMIRPFIIFLFSIIITGTLGAQGISSAIATATIVSEIGVTELDVNNTISFAASKNDVQLVNTERVNVQSNSKSVEIISFKVISNENNFSITIPATYHFAKKDDGLNYMTAELFVTSSVNTKGNQPISITSVFKENNFQSPGNYYSSPLEITVNYN